MNMSIFNFQKTKNMHKDYAYYFFDFIVLKKLQQQTKNKEPKFLGPKSKLVGELNPYSMKNYAQL